MGLVQGLNNKRRVRKYYQTNTNNLSFIKMYNVLRELGVRNNKFQLVLYDPTLKNVNPRDPNLSREMKGRVINEIKKNFWYFIREVVRIPVTGKKGGVKYALHRGNMALNFCLTSNLKSILELPRQNYKTISTVAWYVWLYMYGTENSDFMFMNKKLSDSKKNLKRLRDIIDILPNYLRSDKIINKKGELKESSTRAESAEHPKTNNTISAMPSATSIDKARDLGRGLTQAHQWYDEYHFTKHNKTIYNAATPAYSEAAKSAKSNGKPFGIVITSTPGVLSNEAGIHGYDLVSKSLRFNEKMYDWSRDKILTAMRKTSDTSFLYIRYNYKQLGRSEKWFNDICEDINYDWTAIRREYLLEWAKSSDLSPFSEEDLEIINSMKQTPYKSIMLNNVFQMDLYANIWEQKEPILVGVDVSGGYSRDSTSIVLVSSKTTEVLGVMNTNRISTNDLVKVLKELIVSHIPNAVLSIERNIYGESIISALLDSPIRRNIYYQEKQNEMRETRKNGVKHKTPSSRYEYGVFTKRSNRKLMMDILRDYVNDHKDKFVSPILIDELHGLEYKRGRIDHGSATHDDTVMGYLMALYVYHKGTNLHSFGIERRDLSDDSLTVDLYKKRQEQDNPYSIYEDPDLVDDKTRKKLNLKSGSKTMMDYYREHDKQIFEDRREMNKEKKNLYGDDDEYGIEELSMDFFDELNDI